MECKVCSEGVLGTDKWQAHTRQKHPDLPEQEYVLEFDWGHVKTGDGHYEMNLMKSYVELNREVFFKELFVCLFVCLFVFNDAPTLVGH